MTSPGSLVLYVHSLGVLEGSGFLYIFYRKRAKIARNPALILPAVGFLLFVTAEMGVGFVSPLIVHLGHAAAAALLSFGLVATLFQWTSVNSSTAALFRDEVQPEWMTEMDDSILSMLEQSNIVLSPTLLSYNLGYSRESVNRHLRKLEDHDYVERVDRGKYRLTDSGQEYLYWSTDTPRVALEYTGNVLHRLISWCGRRMATLAGRGQR